MRLGGVDIKPVVSREHRGIKPGAVGKQGVFVEGGDSGFQVKAASHRNPDDLVSVCCDDAGELSNAFRVAARGESDKQFAAESKYIATFEHARKLDMLQFAKRLKRGGDAESFATAGFGAQRKNHGEFIENHGGIFHKHGIG